MSNAIMLQHLGEDLNTPDVQGCLSWLSCHSYVSSKSNGSEPTED